jgi:DNA polymerase-4
MSWFLHIDMDAFFASVEEAIDPSLKGKPVIVGGRNGRGVVTSASYAARKFGVRSAMPGFQAKKLCPQGVFLPNRRRTYVEFSRKVFAILEQYSPAVQALSIDEGVVDLTGTERLFGPPLKTAGDMIGRIERELDLPSSGGLSTSRVIAKIAATLAKPHGLVCVPAGAEKDFSGAPRRGTDSWRRPQKPSSSAPARHQNHRRPVAETGNGSAISRSWRIIGTPSTSRSFDRQ